MKEISAMKVLVVGLGSMGKRRVRNLRALGVEGVIGYDPRADRREEAASKYAVATIGDWAAAATADVDAWVVSTPPDTHFDYAFQATAQGRSFFLEVGVPDPRVDELAVAAARAGVVGAPSCTMSYFPGPKRVKEILNAGSIGRPQILTYHFGHYLPDWHPWENYQDFYVSKRRTGACREILDFDLAWLVDLLGPADAVTAVRGRVGELDCPIDDAYQAAVRFKSGAIGNILIEVAARPPIRRLRLGGSQGTVEWDHAADAVRLWTATGGAWETESLDKGSVQAGYIYAEEPYVAEMRDFLAAVRGERTWPHSFAAESAVMDLVLTIERNSVTGDPV